MTLNKQVKTKLHRAHTRGHADHGWLDTHHSFSFASYYDPSRMGFGRLRVLNDDKVAGGRGFGRHPHRDMEIVSIPLKGGLRHKDSMGNEHVIRTGDVQVMSAGTGIQHAEQNDSTKDPVHFLQIWVIPDRQGVEPRYQQEHFSEADRQNRWQQIVSPDSNDEGLWIHQQAWFQLGKFEAGRQSEYELRGQRSGVYVFLLAGKVKVAGQALESRDGLAVWDTDKLSFQFSEPSEILLIEVPLDE